MDFSRFSKKGFDILLLIMQMIVVALCFSYIKYIYNVDILPDKTVDESFSVTNCIVEDKKFETKGAVFHSYRSSFLVAYSIDAEDYKTWVTGNGLDQSFMSDRAAEQKLFNEYNIGQSYDCWYDPKQPQIAVLTLRHDWASTFPLFIPSVIILIVFYYFARTLSRVIGQWRREKY